MVQALLWKRIYAATRGPFTRKLRLSDVRNQAARRPSLERITTEDTSSSDTGSMLPD
jgi:hypothetical protein